MTSQIEYRYPMNSLEAARQSVLLAKRDYETGIINEETYALVKFKLQTRINQVKRQQLLGSAAKLRTRNSDEFVVKNNRAPPPPVRPQRFGRRSG